MNDWFYIGIRFALYADLMLLFGLPLFSLYALKRNERVRGGVLPLRLPAAVLASLALLISALSIVAMTASMAGVPVAQVDLSMVRSIVSDTAVGHAWLIRMLVLSGICVALFLRPRLVLSALLSVGAGIALGSLAWTGHGAAGEGLAGWLQLSADIAHLWAAGAWLGALAALLILTFRSFSQPSEEHITLLYRSLATFSRIGTAIVGVIVTSGLVNGYMLVGPAHVADLGATTYGRLLIAKLVLFAVMICLAAINRFRLTPALKVRAGKGHSRAALTALKRSIVLESGAAVLIIGLVAWLGTLAPPISI